MGDINQVVGGKGEELAKEFLLKKGYQWVESNFHTRGGEIDLIMLDGHVLVFVEVKRRRSHEYGRPEEAVTPAKMRHMTNTALLYIKAKGIRDKSVRFDVVTVDGDGIRHYPEAFQVEGNYYF